MTVLARGDDPPEPPWPTASATATRAFSWCASTTNQAPSAAARTP